MQGNNAVTAGPNVQDLAHLGAGLGGQDGSRVYLLIPSFLYLPAALLPLLCPRSLSSHLFSWPPIVAKGLPEMDIWPGPCPFAYIEDGMNKSPKAFS